MDHTTKGCESIQLVTAKGGLLKKKAKELHLSHYIKVAQVLYLCLEYFVFLQMAQSMCALRTNQRAWHPRGLNKYLVKEGRGRKGEGCRQG